MSLSAEEKLRVAHRLDDLGIELIEAGFPASNPRSASSSSCSRPSASGRRRSPPSA